METPQPQPKSNPPPDGGSRVGGEGKGSMPQDDDSVKGRFGTSESEVGRLTATIHSQLDVGQCVLEGEEMAIDVPQNELDKKQLCALDNEEMPVNVPLSEVSTSEGEGEGEEDTSEADTLDGRESVVFSVNCCPACQGTIKFIQSKGKFCQSSSVLTRGGQFLLRSASSVMSNMLCGRSWNIAFLITRFLFESCSAVSASV